MTRRSALVGGSVLGALALAGCSDDASSGGGSGTSASGSGASGSGGGGATQATPLKHPAGLSYGTWLRPTSHLLDAASTKAVLVEFLDFECEACGGIFPVIEQLREELKGQLTYAIRYFPLNGHRNSVPAAQAAEAAARQGKLEPMYRQLFQNQSAWTEQQGPVDQQLRGFAQAAGVDLTQWQRDRTSQSVASRVQADLSDANTLRLQGTPSFFFNGQPFQPQSVDDIRNRVRDANKA